MSAFTPGPWTARKCGERTATGYTVAVYAPDDCPERAADARGPTESEALANARLIAAAPELLVELVGLASCVKRGETHDDEGIPTQEYTERARRIAALVAKAKGGA